MRSWIRNLAFVACLLPLPAVAHTFSLPSDSPVINVTIPDSLEPVDTLRGAEGGVSQERTFNVLVEPIDVSNAKTATDEGLKILLLHGNEVDPTSVKQASRKINGLDAVDVSFTITDGVEAAGFTLIATKPGASFMAVIHYGSHEGIKANSAALASIIGSIQPIRK